MKFKTPEISRTMGLRALVLAASWALMGSKAAEPVIFVASVRVEVGADGKPLSIQAPAELPDGIRQFVEKRVASWKYAVTPRDGQAANAVTFVQARACAIPMESGEYRMAVDYLGNGPKMAGRPQPPPMPAMAFGNARNRTDTAILAHLAIREDGVATVERIEYILGNAAQGRRLGYDKAVTRWAEGLRFVPETFAGKATAAKGTVQVNYAFTDTFLQETWSNAKSSMACNFASGETPMPDIAWESAIKVTPDPSG